jgi:hypothetical protein
VNSGVKRRTMNEWIYSLVFPYIYIHMKLIITESKISNALHKYLNLSYEGFDNCYHDWAEYNCGMGVCCDPYAIGFNLPDSEYNEYLFKLVDGRHYDDDGDYPSELSDDLPEVCEDRPDLSNREFESILISEEMYDGLTDMFGDINHWRDSLLSLINKIFNTNARHLMYIYESDM